MFGKLKDHVVFSVLFNILFYVEIYSTKNPLDLSFNISQIHTGFHRHLCYDACVQRMVGGSKILIEETFSEDMYIDPYQVSERNEVLIKEAVDCEIPAYLANEFKVQLCSLSENNYHHICIPFHLRYQLPHQCKIRGESLTVYSNIRLIFLSKFINQSYAFSDECFLNKVNDSWIYLGQPKGVNFHLQICIYGIRKEMGEKKPWFRTISLCEPGFSRICCDKNKIDSPTDMQIHLSDITKFIKSEQ